MFFWKYYYILFSFLSLYKKDDNRTLRKKSFEVCEFGNHPYCKFLKHFIYLVFSFHILRKKKSTGIHTTNFFYALLEFF